MENIAVSVYCLAYNHEKYIRKTLEGFVMQRTNFKYEVYVHDDASFDGTANIIREYEEKYPDIIKGIYQKENQYSKGVKIFSTYILPQMKGKYVASCEGDDYWSHPDKLQRQYDSLKNNPNIKLCVHKVGVMSESGEPKREFYPAENLKEGVISRRKFLSLISTDFFQLSSYFLELQTLKKYTEEKPDFVRKADVGDIPKLLFYAVNSDEIYYIDEVFSYYRQNSISSWNKYVKKQKERLIKHNKSMVEMIQAFDEYTNHQYPDFCQNFISKEQFELTVKQYDVFGIMSNAMYRKMFRKMPVRTKVSIIVKGIQKRLGRDI